jgi:hypothetical protein
VTWYDSGFAEASPLISLARARYRAHGAFDAIWRQHPGDKRRVRNLCYRWLAHQLSIHEDLAHMKLMDEAACNKVVEICRGARLADVLEWWAARRVESNSNKEN